MSSPSQALHKLDAEDAEESETAELVKTLISEVHLLIEEVHSLARQVDRISEHLGLVPAQPAVWTGATAGVGGRRG